MLLVLMLQCWRAKKRPTKEEEQLGFELALKYRPRSDRLFLMFRSEAGVASSCSCCDRSEPGVRRQESEIGSALSTRRVFLTRGNDAWNELPSGTDSAHWAEQQNLVSPLTRRSKTDVSTPSVQWALDTVEKMDVCYKKGLT